jgi:hypothetical protein
MLYGKDNKDNPYVEAFWKWWEGELQHSLRELRVTGGEPTMSKDFWKLMNWWENHKECDVRFAVNSNLGQKQELVDRLIAATHNFKEIDIYTSGESVGKHAEYIRDGKDWNRWITNVEKILRDGNVRTMNVMMTINALCLFSITEFLDEMNKLREKYINKTPLLMTLNILRFPSFQSVSTLPEDIRLERAEHLQNWVENFINSKPSYYNDTDLWGLANQIYRLCEYLREVTQGHRFSSDLRSRQRDFKSFYQQYDIRRNKNFIETFPELEDWFDMVRESRTDYVQEIKKVRGDENNLYKLDYEKRALEEGIVTDDLENEIIKHLENE